MKVPKHTLVVLFSGIICSFWVFGQNEVKIAYQDKAPNAKTETVPSEDIFDLIFDYPCAVGAGEAGIECDETYIYTTKWNGDQFYKYDLTGTLVDSFSISGVSGIRDLAWDGNYFYGGAASTTVYELDFENELLISSFTAPTQVRAIAYDDNNNTFYANNWSTDITQFNMSGSNLGSFQVGPAGDSYYGFAYENKTGYPFLWGYAQVGATQNEIIQLTLPSGNETGLAFDLGNVLNISSGIAGGLCASDVCYDFALIGMSQNEYIWALEITTAGCCQDNDIGVWSIVEPTSGGGFSNSEPVTINIYNNGWNPQSNFAVSFTHNGSEPYYDTILTTLNFDETIEFTFDTTIDLSMGGTHYIEASTHLLNDECIINDAKNKTIFSPPSPGSLEGYITNAQTGNPIEGALVELEIYTTTTGADGYYFISDITPGSYDLFCASAGFCPFDTTLTFEPDQNLTLNIALEYALLEISEDTMETSLYPNSSTFLNFELYNPGSCNNSYYATGDVIWLGYPTTISGIISPGSTQALGWLTSSYNLEPGLYEGNIIINSFAISSPDSIHVLLEVLGYTSPSNLSGYVDCTDICLNWDPPATGSPLYYNIYRDGNLITNFNGIEFCDQNLDPETEYCYQVSAVYVSGESEPTDELCLTVPMPSSLEPEDVNCQSYGYYNNIWWDPPSGCLGNDGYFIYRNGLLLNTEPLLETIYYDEVSLGYYEYLITALYYFGESQGTMTYCISTNTSNLSEVEVEFYPNPVKDWLVVRSMLNIDQIDIYNNFGEKIFSKSDESNKTIVDLTGNKPGIYFIRTEIAGEIINRKIILK
ncbi:MAG: carboxypeptidase regulatory-like domain-containing protein [Bacteroidetes bacterium]|nr:carboxypeptidase regulatory-like domain-containing protein [Bacteroidota bacterium]